MKIAVSPYELKSLTPLGRSAGIVRSGALLRIEHEDLGIGYADCHPWPELGDEPLERQIASLSAGRTTPLTSRSLSLARIDAEFREAGNSAFSDAGLIPESHLLLGNALDLTETDLDRAVQASFRSVKIKAGKHPAEESRALRGLAGAAQKRNLKLRIDLNESLDAGEAFSFFDVLRSGGGAEAIDFIEDPILPSLEAWPLLKERFPIRLALDRGGLAALDRAKADIFVLKPALQDPEAALERMARSGHSLVITSYLDHPLGTASAAWYASRAKKLLGSRLETCGLMSHLNYEETPFSRGLAKTGPFWIPPEGTGFGFDEELARLRWKTLP